jgi:hypothetical protein
LARGREDERHEEVESTGIDTAEDEEKRKKKKSFSSPLAAYYPVKKAR